MSRSAGLLATVFLVIGCASGGDDAGDGGNGAENHPPAVAIDGQTSLVASLARGEIASYLGTAEDPDGDPMTTSWAVWSLSDPTVECAADFAVTVVSDLVTITVPTLPSSPECAGDVLLVFGADDGTATSTAAVTMLLEPAPPPITVAFAAERADVAIGSNSATVADALVYASSKPDAAKVYTWSVVGSSSAASCPLGAVSVLGGSDANTGSTRAVTVTSATQVGCTYTLQIEARFNPDTGFTASDTVALLIVNHPPRVEIAGATEDPAGEYHVKLPPGTAPTLTSVAIDDDRHNLTITWTPDPANPSEPTSCAFGCTAGPATPTGFPPSTRLAVPFAPLGAGETFGYTIVAFDGFAAVSARLVVEAEPCLWVDDGAALGGSGTLARPFATIQEGFDALKSAPSKTNLCIIEGAYALPPTCGTPSAACVVPAMPFSPDLLGGFDATGAPGAPRARVDVENAEGLRFAPGYDGVVSRLEIHQTGSTVVVGGRAAVTVTGAQPTLADCDLRGNDGPGSGDPEVGLQIDLSGAGPTAPRLVGSVVTGSMRATANDVFGVLVTRAAGPGSPSVGGGNRIVAGTGTGLGVGVRYEGSAPVDVHDNESIQVCASGGPCTFTDGYGIQLLPGALDAAAPSGSISGNALVGIGGSLEGRAAAIRLQGTSGVSIDGNREIGSGLDGGRSLSLGVADGEILADGTIAPGSSSALTIAGNGAIRGGMHAGSVFASCESTRVAAALLLAGTGGGSVVRDNGWLDAFNAGVRGGSTTVNWNGTDRVPPSVPGIWTVETNGLTLENNRVFSGNLSAATSPECALPSEPPANVALRDGLPPAPGAGTGGRASAGLRLERNSLVCDAQPQGAGGPPLPTRCAAVELNVPTAVSLGNNIMANVVGARSIGLWVRGGGGVDARHNTINPDLEFAGDVAPNSLEKYGVLLDGIGADVLLANNLIHVQRDDPADIPGERLAIWERTSAGGSAVGTFVANLIFVQDDDVTSTTAPAYFRVDGAAGRVEYAADAINAVSGIGTIHGNLVAAPGLTDPGAAKWLLRLADPGSAAVGACEPDLSLPVDIDLDARASDAGCDIGADEL